MSNAVFKDGMIPDFPDPGRWSGLLRWMIAVMDDDDKALPFIASCLSHCLKNGGLSERQEASCYKVAMRLRDRWHAMTLDCQVEDAEDVQTSDLSGTVPMGSC